MRVIDLTTGRGWDTRVRGTALNVQLTGDGQAFIANIRSSSSEEDTGAKLKEIIPQIAKFLGREYLVLYHQDGRAVARLDLKDYLKHRPPDWFYPSPDGRSIAVIDSIAVNSVLKPECLLYRY